jgi:hypothetical protein
MLNDLWYTLSDKVYFLNSTNFDKAPASPAVYAWYYPLRVSTDRIHDFMNQIGAVLAYDSKNGGRFSDSATFGGSWRDFTATFSINDFSGQIPDTFIRAWNRALASDKDQLRRDIMLCSVLMPPLYVGKTLNLSRRIREHIEGRPPHQDFHARFSRYAKAQQLPQREVSDLLCLGIVTSRSEEPDDYIKLIEFIMKKLAGPGFSAS